MHYFANYYPDCQTYDLKRGWRQDVFRALAQGVENTYLGSVSGDIAEFGTGGGGTAQLLAEAIAVYEVEWKHDWTTTGRRNLHLFDSFAGYPETRDEHEQQAPRVISGYWGKGRNVGLSREQLTTACAQHLDTERICVHPGFFDDTAWAVEFERPLAMLHLDCNLYESTATVLTALFERDLLADGCLLFFDDWNCSRASPHFGQRRAWAECVERFAPEFSDSGEYAGSGHKFIIHRSPS